MAGVLSIVSIEKTFQHPCFPDDGFARMSDSNADLVNQVRLCRCSAGLMQRLAGVLVANG